MGFFVVIVLGIFSCKRGTPTGDRDSIASIVCLCLSKLSLIESFSGLSFFDTIGWWVRACLRLASCAYSNSWTVLEDQSDIAESIELSSSDEV